MDTADAAAEAGEVAGAGPYYLRRIPPEPTPHPAYDPSLPVHSYAHYYPPPGAAPAPPGPGPAPAPASYYPPPPAVSVPYSYVPCLEPEGGGRRGGYVYSARPVHYCRDPAAQDGHFVAEHASVMMDPSTEQPSFVNAYLHRNASPPQAKMQNPKGKLIKKTKVLQTVFCGFCNIECNSKDVFDTHILGKRHMKNVERLHPRSASKPNVSVIGATTPKQSTAGQEVSNSKRKEPCASKPEVDLEIKKQKVMACGADPEGVRICTICNVVCNSDLVFNFHLAGQKHATQLKKQINGTAAA